MTKRNTLIDLTKLFMILCVCLIHFPFADNIIKPVARVAIPLFFLFSGFLLANSKKPEVERAKKNIWSAFKYLVLGYAVYGLYVLIVCEIIGEDYYNRSHLWFVVSLLGTAIIHYIFCKINKTNLYLVISLLLLVGCLILGQYSNSLGLGYIRTKVTRNAIFTGFPLFALGYYTCKKKLIAKSSWKYLLLAAGIIFMALQPLENWLLNGDEIGKGRIYLSSLIAAYLIFFFVISTPITLNTKYLSPRIVFNIYIFHRFFGNHLAEVLPSELVGVVTFLTTFIACEIAFLIILTIKNKYKNHKLSQISPVPQS